MNRLEVQVAALDRFRELYGVNADPEDYELEWDAVLMEVAEQFQECASYPDEEFNQDAYNNAEAR